MIRGGQFKVRLRCVKSGWGYWVWGGKVTWGMERVRLGYLKSQREQGEVIIICWG
jgi:hypothetical protein